MATQEKQEPYKQGAGAPLPDGAPERVTFFLSVAIVLALFVFLGLHAWQAARPGDKEAQPSVRVWIEPEKAILHESGASPSQWLLPVQVKNSGNIAVEEIQVTVSYQDAQGKEQESDITFGYLAEKGASDAYAVLDAPPAKAKPEARVTSFQVQRDARGY